MAMAHRPLRRRSISASLTIALEDHVGRQIAAKQRPRLVSCKGSKGSCRGWRSGGGKHLGHRTARCSLRGNGSSCSARPKGPQPFQGLMRKSARRCPTERVGRFSATYARGHALIRSGARVAQSVSQYLTVSSRYQGGLLVTWDLQNRDPRVDTPRNPETSVG